MSEPTVRDKVASIIADFCANCSPEGGCACERKADAIIAMMRAEAADLIDALVQAAATAEAWIADGGHAECGSGRDVYLTLRAALARAKGEHREP